MKYKISQMTSIAMIIDKNSSKSILKQTVHLSLLQQQSIACVTSTLVNMFMVWRPQQQDYPVSARTPCGDDSYVVTEQYLLMTSCTTQLIRVLIAVAEAAAIDNYWKGSDFSALHREWAGRHQGSLTRHENTRWALTAWRCCYRHDAKLMADG